MADDLWYKNALIYELHVRTFFDSNADGVGDFRGLIGKLDYLQELGITCLWLLPFYQSPLKDDGYDIADYYRLLPAYGTMQDFQDFIAAAYHRLFSQWNSTSQNTRERSRPNSWGIRAFPQLVASPIFSA